MSGDKQKIFLIAILLLLMGITAGGFIGIAVILNRQAVKRQEQMFNAQQALQTLLAKQAIEDHIQGFFNGIRMMASYDLREFVRSKKDLSSLQDLFQLAQSVYPSALSYLYYDASSRLVHVHPDSTLQGKAANEIASKWVEAYRDKLSRLQNDYIVPPFLITSEHQMLGFLFPVQANGHFMGILAAVMDLQPIIQRYVATMRSGKYGAGYVLDGHGNVVYDHETFIIGRNVFDGLHADYPEVMRVDRRLVQEPFGMDEYTFTIQRGGTVSRKLIAWHSLTLGYQKFVICLSAPDIEIDQTLSALRLQWIVSGGFLAAVYMLISLVVFRTRHRGVKKNAQELQQQVERRTAELAASETRYRTLFESANDAIWLMANDRVVDCNARTLEMFGCSSEEIFGSTPYEFSPPTQPDGSDSKEKALQKIKRAIEGQPQFFEWMHCRADGTPFSAEINLNRVELSGTYFIMAIIRDITERKKVEEQIYHLNEELERRVVERTQELEQANAALYQSLERLTQTQSQLIQAEKMAALGGLVAGVAHEINTPVGIGVTAASYLDMRTQEIATHLQRSALTRSELEGYLKTAQESSDIVLSNLQRAAKLIQSFKQVAVDQSLEEKRRINLKTYIDDIFLSLQPRLKKTQYKILIECSETIEITTFPGAFSQIITNLVMNSLIHAFEKQEQGEIRIHILQKNDTLIFTYQDNGRGIPEEHLVKIFDPFFTTRRSEGGSGLGMYIVYNLVTQKLKGVIHCQSQPGEGVRFTLVLPLSV